MTKGKKSNHKANQNSSYASNITKSFQKTDTAGKIAIGATGVAITAAAIAAGAALAQKGMRDKVGSSLKKAASTLRDASSDFSPKESYQAFSHQIVGDSKKRRGKSKKSSQAGRGKESSRTRNI